MCGCENNWTFQGDRQVVRRGQFVRHLFAIKLPVYMTQIKRIGNPFTRSQQLLLNWLLACTLLVAQTLGLMHGVVHGLQSASGPRVSTSLQAVTRIDPAQQVAQAAQRVQAGASAISAASWVNALFSSHNGENDCRLYDQASHGSIVPQVAVLALPVVLPPLAVAIFQGEALARWAAFFDARGPPLTS